MTWTNEDEELWEELNNRRNKSIIDEALGFLDGVTHDVKSGLLKDIKVNYIGECKIITIRMKDK